MLCQVSDDGSKLHVPWLVTCLISVARTLAIVTCSVRKEGTGEGHDVAEG